MSEATKSVAALAVEACAMPWEDKAPFSVRYAFTEAVTPELFVELLDALSSFVYEFGDKTNSATVNKARAAIAKATGSS